MFYLFVIFGFGHRKFKKFGFVSENCRRCNNYVNRELIKATSWFTLFFIPLIPYSTKYLLVCPICQDMIEVPKDEFFRLANGGTPEYSNQTLHNGNAPADNDNKYAGKTPTQINYIKQMEEYERKEKELNNR